MPDEVTLIDGVVAPLDHKYELPLLAVRVTLPPWQNVVAPPGVIVAVGAGFTVTVVGDDVAPQLPLETVTL